jgi:hypothetical protein
MNCSRQILTDGDACFQRELPAGPQVLASKPYEKKTKYVKDSFLTLILGRDYHSRCRAGSRGVR